MFTFNFPWKLRFQNGLSNLSFDKCGLIRINGKTFGEFNIDEMKKIRSMMKGASKIMKNEIRNRNYRLVFKDEEWGLYKFTMCGKHTVNVLKVKGRCHFSRFNETERKLFFSHSSNR